ncbi:MAG: R3H domain-containing nucleic acid-binding protein [Candidatus Nealsonbacteria bacterium]
MKKEDLKKIKNITEEFFQKTSFETEVKVKETENSTVSVELKMEEPQVLIGEGGQTLFEIQRLLKIILKKSISTEEPFFVDFDINEYKKKKQNYLKEMARSAADEVVLSRKEKKLAPMPAYERRIVHMELASRSDITTESFGEGLERSVVIKPSS